ncbi:hypothetical protein N7462_008411 [Penicillium macrosclerotiorum]|uniref:uncharacterized protein n=1 Tax=Penicillium macrosclerotiorum TaxID=303699 RepID=UPI002547A327|nr:uncharacterized protein N7462_008411 [Penicillium macrosclerotiorum]KAJ5675514.1 hypothetical protein N7462_008411 [Penicillium macrosclerotiorum]
MPPRKGVRKSMPARINHLNNATLTPSRRSPRVPTGAKSTNGSPPSSKSLDLSSTTSSPEDPFNVDFYNPKTPSTTRKSRDISPDAPLTGRRPFQARPSRLSTVYTPVVETTLHSSQSSRRTRRTAALETSQNEYSDSEFPDTLGSTGWTYDQYMGGRGSNGTMDRHTSPGASSKGTRTSGRIRKPTMKAIEAMESKPKPRNTRKSTPASTKRQTEEMIEAMPPSALLPAPTLPPSRTRARAPIQALTPIVRKGKKVSKAKKGKKNSKPEKPQLQRIQIDVERAGQKLYELAALALGTDFVAPPDAEEFIRKARTEYRKLEMDELIGTPRNFENTPKDAKAKADSKSQFFDSYKKKTAPKIDADGWIHSGCINKFDEEVVLSPAEHSPYRSPHTYGDENLPFPPVRIRSGKHVENDNALGFPPLIGDRNIPFDSQSQFQPEDVIEEKAKAKARGEACKKNTIKPNPAQTEHLKKSAARKRGLAETESESTNAIASVAPGGPNPRKRRREERVSMPARVSTVKNTRSKTPISQASKATKTTAAAPGPTLEAKPQFPRLRLTLKPQNEKERQKSSSPSDDSSDSPVEKAPTKKSAAEGRRKRVIDITSDSEATKEPIVAKGKKRVADLISDDKVIGNSKTPTKRPRIAADSDAESTPTAPKGRGRSATTTIATPKAAQGRGRARGASKAPSTPARNRKRATSAPSIRGRGRGRGRGA